MCVGTRQQQHESIEKDKKYRDRIILSNLSFGFIWLSILVAQLDKVLRIKLIGNVIRYDEQKFTHSIVKASPNALRLDPQLPFARFAVP